MVEPLVIMLVLFSTDLITLSFALSIESPPFRAFTIHLILSLPYDSVGSSFTFCLHRVRLRNVYLGRQRRSPVLGPMASAGLCPDHRRPSCGGSEIYQKTES